MKDYESYKNQLEAQYNCDLRELLYDLYVAKDIGPSVGAKQLGIPRQVFIHFRNVYQLQELKYEGVAQNEWGCEQ